MSFSSERPVKAVRKAHRCQGCSTMIEVGQPAERWAGMTDGDFSAVIYHTDCRAAEIALNKLSGADWDEWISLEEIDDEDWEWLLDAYPGVAVRMGITAPEAASPKSVTIQALEDQIPHHPSTEREG